MEDKKKKFIIPEAEIVNFLEDDIITGSGGLTEAEDNPDWPFGDENL